MNYILIVAFSLFVIALVITLFVYKIAVIKKQEFSKITLLRDILNYAFTTEDPVLAAKKIVELIANKYNLDYFTLFVCKPDSDILKCLYSNVESKYLSEISAFSNSLYKNYLINKNKAAIIKRSNSALEYVTATERERNIRYMYFMPLVLNNSTVGAILVENRKNINVDGFTLTFFKDVLHNISISVQHLIYLEHVIMLANIDALTKVFNKKYLIEQLSVLINKCKTSQSSFSLAIFDIDYFKKFNDTHGHLFGDKVLKDIANIAYTHVRKEIDTVYRYGGEEFIIIMPGISKKEAFKSIEELRNKIQEFDLTKEDGTVVKVTCSFGISTFIENGITLNDIIKSADSALYISKNNGRNQTTCS